MTDAIWNTNSLYKSLCFGCVSGPDRGPPTGRPGAGRRQHINKSKTERANGPKGGPNKKLMISAGVFYCGGGLLDLGIKWL